MTLRTDILKFGQILAKKYRVEKAFAAGGYAIVYHAVRIEDGVQVVVKALRAEAAEGDPAAVARFIREAAIATHLDHPNIVKILDFGQTRDSILYIILELLRGHVLEDIMYKGPIAPDHTKHLLKQILQALGEAHKQGIIHRDIKPSNIFICKANLEDKTFSLSDSSKILDFGFVKVVQKNHPFSRRLTMAGQKVGTPGYMAPEMLLGDVALSPQVDLYAVGILGYEMLTGKAAFGGRGMQRAMAQIKTVPDLPSMKIQSYSIYKVVKRLMERNPNRRYKTAVEALKDIQGGSEGSSQSGGSWMKFWSR